MRSQTIQDFVILRANIISLALIAPVVIAITYTTATVSAGGKEVLTVRLIDKDAFLERMKRTDRYFSVVYDIEAMPEIDAEPVVRCKECEYGEFAAWCSKYSCKRVQMGTTTPQPLRGSSPYTGEP